MPEPIRYQPSRPYRGFMAGTSDEWIRKWFLRRFGVEPDLTQAKRYSHTIMVPEPEESEK